MVCLNRQDKLATYVGSIASGFILWIVCVLFRTQIIDGLNKYDLINQKSLIIAVLVLSLIVILLMMLYTLLDPAPKNCVHIMEITSIGLIFGGGLAFVIFEPLDFLGAGFVWVIFRTVLAIGIIGLSIHYLFYVTSARYQTK